MSFLLTSTSFCSASSSATISRWVSIGGSGILIDFRDLPETKPKDVVPASLNKLSLINGIV